MNSAQAALSDLMSVRLEERDPETFAEIRRICGLPIVWPLSPEEVTAVSQHECLATATAEGFELLEPQANGVLSYDAYGGLFAKVGVGRGKTLLSLMLAERGWRKGLRRILLLLPASTLRKTIGGKHGRGEIAWARSKVPLSVSFFPLRGRKKMEAQLSQGWDGCYIASYNSVSNNPELVKRVAPDLIICDEAHALKNRRAACTKRVLSWVDEHGPDLCVMSGTMTGKGLKDYWHLIRAALRNNCPLPLTSTLCDEWGSVIDSTASSRSSDAATGPIMPLVEWAQRHDPEAKQYPETLTGFRQAYALRLTTSPGVVNTGDTEVGTSIIMVNDPAPVPQGEDAKELERLMLQLEQQWLTPNLDEIEHAIHIYKWKYELTTGFYNELYWETPEQLSLRHARGGRPMTESEASGLLDRAREHHGLKNEYNRILRGWLKDRGHPGLDTPMLVGAAIARGASLDSELVDAWKAARAAEFEGMPERQSRAVRICDYKVAHAARWAQKAVPKGRGAVIWYYHAEIGRWLKEEFERVFGEGRVVYAPAGEKSNEKLTEFEPKNCGKDPGVFVIASVSAHGTGKELQTFQHQLYVQWPRSAILAEQSLGRLHRLGQQADELLVFRCDTTDFDVQNFSATLNDSVYIHQSTRDRQKLVFASYDPLPTVYPTEWLHENGFNVKKLSAEQQALLVDKFGGPQ